MTIDNLIELFGDTIVKSNAPIPYFSLEEGVRLLLPPCHTAPKGTIFIGTLVEWNILRQTERLQPECTYLISVSGESCDSMPYELPVNLIFLDATVHVIQQRLTTYFLEIDKHSGKDNTAMQYMSFWNDILSGSLTNRAQIVNRLSSFPYPMHRYIACIVVRPGNLINHDYENQEILDVLRNFFPNTNLFYTGTEWIILYSHIKDTSDHLDISYDGFSALLEQYKLSAGISYVCRLPEMLRTLYLTAAASIDLGKELEIMPYRKQIYTYHQYNPYYITHLCAQKYAELHNTENLVYLMHPDIIKLYFYDLENHSNLLDVLFTYLNCGKNLSLTSQKLYMHRNTVLNKLSKIEEFLQHKLEYDTDHLLLLLSCVLVKYQHYYTHRPLYDLFSSDAADTDHQ